MIHRLGKMILIVAEQLGVSTLDLKPETRLVADLGCDSLDGVELLMAVEDEFSLEIDDKDAEACITIGDCAALVDRYLSSKAGHQEGAQPPR
jgi:acyl carrier protein